jgi:hypothetical protein
VIRVEKPDEKDQIRQLKKQIRQLKEALGQSHAEKVLGDAFLEIACEELGEDVDQFKKKVEVIPKPALMSKMRTFGVWRGGRSRHSGHYSDGDRRSPDVKRAICRPNEVLGWLLDTMRSTKPENPDQ